MKKKKLLIFGNYGGQNWGDEAILDALLWALPHNKYDIAVVSSDSVYTENMHHVQSVSPPPFGLRSFFKVSWLAFFQTLRQVDLVLFGGGGLFQDREPRAVILWWYYVRICRFFGKRIIFVANSIGPLSTERARMLVTRSFQDSPYISVRDRSSRNLLQEVDVSSKNIVQSTDAIFLRFPKRSKLRKGSLILLRGDGNITPQRIKKLFKYIPKPIVAIAMDRIDVPFASQLGIPVWIPESVDDLQKKIANSELVLSSRLHGGLLALLQKTPFVMFAAAPKIKHFFQSCELGELVVSERFQIPAVRRLLDDFQKNPQKWKKRFHQVAAGERQKGKKILPHFLQKL